MKKNIVLVLLALVCAFASQAQSNKTYYMPGAGNELQGQSIALLNKHSTKEYVVGAIWYDTAAPIMYPKYMLTKMSATGFPIISLMRDSTFMVERIMETFDSCIITVSDFYDQVLVNKYDQSLSLMWTTSIQKLVPGGASTYYGAIDIEPVYRPSNPPGMQEDYYIYFSEGSSDPTAYPYDETHAVAKVNENGNLMWHKVYYDVNRSTYDWWVIEQDKANSLEAFPDATDPNRINLALAGTRLYYDPGQSINLYYMTIDEDGNILQQLRNVINDYSEHYCQDIHYDGDSLVASFTQENAHFQDPTIASAYSIMKFDTALSSFRGRSLWNDCENVTATLSIATTDSVYQPGTDDMLPRLGPGTDKNYILSGWIGKCYPMSNPYAYANPGFMKIDRITLDPIWLNRYNVFTQGWVSIGSVWNCYHRTDEDENNYLAYDPRWNGSGVDIRGFRVLVTDPALDACGAKWFNVHHYDLKPIAYNYTYDVIEFTQPTSFPLREMRLNLTSDDCKDLPDADSWGYKGTAVNTVSTQAFSIDVKPTIIRSENEMVSCKMNSLYDGPVEIVVSDMVGRVVYSRKYEVKKGENNMRISTASFAKGMNVVHISGGGYTTSAKVNVLY